MILSCPSDYMEDIYRVELMIGIYIMLGTWHSPPGTNCCWKKCTTSGELEIHLFLLPSTFVLCRELEL